MSNYRCIALTIFGLVLGFIIAAFIIGPAQNTAHRDVGLSTPVITYTPPPVKQEDDPTWDCYEDGNRVCGDVDKLYADAAWDQWDAQNGATFLRIDPSREYRVEYVGTAMIGPALRCNEAALPSLNIWYIFRATYMDGTAACP